MAPTPNRDNFDLKSNKQNKPERKPTRRERRAENRKLQKMKYGKT